MDFNSNELKDVKGKRIMTCQIKLYGTERCHKTKYYKNYLEVLNLDCEFIDVELNAEVLRNLYENRKLNFPTIIIGEKKLRNPTDKGLKKWIKKLT